MQALSTRRAGPGFWPTLATLLLLPLLAGLGVWQLQRAAEKEALFVAFERGAEPVPVSGPGVAQQLEALPRFQAVRLQGRYLPERQFLLDNMTDGGRAGYRVLTPFLPADASEPVLVDRGWLEKAFDGNLPELAVDAGPRELAGRVARLPRPGLELDGGAPGEGWPRVVQFPTAGELEAVLGRPLSEAVILLDPAEPDGFLRVWRPDEMGPERHLGYAVQWFALAVTLLVIYVAVGFRRKRNDAREKD